MQNRDEKRAIRWVERAMTGLTIEEMLNDGQVELVPHQTHYFLLQRGLLDNPLHDCLLSSANPHWTNIFWRTKEYHFDVERVNKKNRGWEVSMLKDEWMKAEWTLIEVTSFPYHEYPSFVTLLRLYHLSSNSNTFCFTILQLIFIGPAFSMQFQLYKELKMWEHKKVIW